MTKNGSLSKEYRQLTISDPHYAAHYGNHLLKEHSPLFEESSLPPPPLHIMPKQVMPCFLQPQETYSSSTYQSLSAHINNSQNLFHPQENIYEKNSTLAPSYLQNFRKTFESDQLPFNGTLPNSAKSRSSFTGLTANSSEYMAQPHYGSRDNNSQCQAVLDTARYKQVLDKIK